MMSSSRSSWSSSSSSSSSSCSSNSSSSVLSSSYTLSLRYSPFHSSFQSTITYCILRHCLLLRLLICSSSTSILHRHVLSRPDRCVYLVFLYRLFLIKFLGLHLPVLWLVFVVFVFVVVFCCNNLQIHTVECLFFVPFFLRVPVIRPSLRTKIFKIFLISQSALISVIWPV